MGIFDYVRNLLLDFGIEIRLSKRFSWTGYTNVTKHSEINWARFVELGKKQVGKPYRYGVEVNLKDPNPPALDCSELIEWLFSQIGIVVPDGSYNQFKVSNQIVGDPLIGDLAFKWIPETQSIHHVAVWVGDSVLEAKGQQWGIVLTPRTEFEKSTHFAMWRRLQTIADA